MDATIDFLHREVCRHDFKLHELKVLFVILRRARLFRLEIEGRPMEVLEARFPIRLFEAWTGIRIDHVEDALRSLSESRVMVPHLWFDGVYQLYGQSEGWKVRSQFRASLANAEQADAIALEKPVEVDRRADLAAEAGVQFNSALAAATTNLAGAADVAKPTGSGVPARPEESNGPTGSIPHLINQMREAAQNGFPKNGSSFPKNGSSFPKNGSESPGIREEGEDPPEIREMRQAADVAKPWESNLPKFGKPIRNVRNDQSTSRTNVTFKAPGNLPRIEDLSDDGRAALQELVQLNGSDRPLRKYAALWITAAATRPTSVWEGLSEAKAARARGDITSSFAGYAWGCVKAKFTAAEIAAMAAME